MSELNYKSDIVEVYVKSDIITLNITNSVLGGTGGGGGASYLDDLTDVTITAPASGEFIRYNGTVWVDATIQAGDLPSGLDALKIADGSVSNTEFQYLNGVTSAIQTQIDGKAASSHTHAISDVTNLQTTLDGKAASSHSHVISDVTGLQTALDSKAASSHTHAISDVTNLQTTLDGKAASSHTHSISDVTNLQSLLDGKVDENAAITGATKTKITYDAKGLVTAGADLSASDLPTGIDAAKIADGSISNTEFQYLNNVSSNIQTQLNAKASSSHTHALDDLTDVTITTPSNNQVLKYNGTAWVNDTSPAGATNLDGLTDVTITSPTNNQVLKYNGTTWVNDTAPSGATDLDGLTDVTITGATSGEYLRYNGTAWVDASIQAGDLPTGIDAAKLADGTISNTELQYLNGVTSAIQTQIDGKAATSHSHAISDVTGLQTALDGKVTGNAAITGATKTKITYDAKGLVTAGADAVLDDLGDVVITTPSTNQVLTYNGTNWVNAAATGGVSDGDKGDITVSNGGTTWTIDAGAVTYADIQNVAANSFLANVTGSAATVQAVATNRIPLFGSAITGTPSASTYLRGDGSWATVSGTGISTLNTLTDTTQSFAVGTSGTNFNISSATGVHTFNIPDASATARGLITTGAQTIAGAKTFSSAPILSSLNITGAILYTSASGTIQNTNAFAFSSTASDEKLTVGVGSKSSIINFNYGSGYGGGFTGSLSGTEQMQFGFNNSAAFGGTANVSSGRLLYFYDSIAAKYMAAFSTGGFYIGESTSLYTLWIERPNVSVTGVKITSNGDLQMADGKNIIAGSTNGLKIGSATTQKLGFFNKAPVVQPTTAVAAAAFTANTGTAVNDASTFGGYTIKQVVQALQNLGLLA